MKYIQPFSIVTSSNATQILNASRLLKDQNEYLHAMQDLPNFLRVIGRAKSLLHQHPLMKLPFVQFFRQ